MLLLNCNFKAPPTMTTTLQFVVKTLLSALIIYAVTEVAKRNNGAAALIHSLPWTSMLVLLWLWQEKAAPETLAEHTRLVFWYVLPTLPMFLAFGPIMQRIGFWGAIASYVLGTYLLFLLTVKLATLCGVKI
jgi:hypothetical protein